MDEDSQRRRHFRLRYPHREWPQLLTKTGKFRVVEISEGGARIQFAGRPPTCFRHAVDAQIFFRDGTKVETNAIHHRIDKNEVILRFTKPIPLYIVIGEQRRLMKLYDMGP